MAISINYACDVAAFFSFQMKMKNWQHQTNIPNNFQFDSFGLPLYNCIPLPRISLLFEKKTKIEYIFGLYEAYIIPKLLLSSIHDHIFEFFGKHLFLDIFRASHNRQLLDWSVFGICAIKYDQIRYIFHVIQCSVNTTMTFFTMIKSSEFMRKLSRNFIYCVDWMPSI